MNPDDFKQAWQTQSSQTRLTIDTERVLKDVQLSQQQFTAMIVWRDVCEVSVSLLLIPVWLFMGVKLALPWSWYLTVPVLLWIAGFMLVDRMRHRRQPPEPGEPLRQHVERLLAQVEHQIWLLRNVLWWYLLPPGLSILAFFGQIAWEMRSEGWLTVLFFMFLVTVVVIVYGGIYRVNQHAVRVQLVPKRQELEALLTSLNDEMSDVNSLPTE